MKKYLIKTNRTVFACFAHGYVPNHNDVRHNGNHAFYLNAGDEVSVIDITHEGVNVLFYVKRGNVTIHTDKKYFDKHVNCVVINMGKLWRALS